MRGLVLLVVAVIYSVAVLNVASPISSGNLDETPDTGLEPLGCYSYSTYSGRNKGPFSPTFAGDWYPQTPLSCSLLCSEGGRLYSAVQDKDECFCSRVPPAEEDRAPDEEECSSLCPGESEHNCGGPNAMSVYFAGRNGSTWDRAYHEASMLLSKITFIRNLKTSIKANEAMLETVQSKLDKDRPRLSQLQKEVSEHNMICLKLNMDNKEDNKEELDLGPEESNHLIMEE